MASPTSTGIHSDSTLSRRTGRLALNLVWAAAIAASIIAFEAFAFAPVVGNSEAEPVERIELSKEWRWERKPITFDRMFRQKRDDF